ncbi:MAG TPA: zinc ribbon domain-containing protein [Desulfohalobiaceae bacterium]|nr:zinc ribbon domain-containing protein [Desulfohalobiaceae bacterium]
MPIFEYECQNCQHCFEHLILTDKISNEPQCPKCQSKNLVQLMSLGHVRPQGIPKGSGGFNVPQCINNEQERHSK